MLERNGKKTEELETANSYWKLLFNRGKDMYLPEKGMYSMNRTSIGYVLVSSTKSTISSSLKPLMATQLI